MKDFCEEWVGFDLDRTLAHYDKFRGLDHIGEPIPAMVTILKNYLARGVKCKIFTARVCNLDGQADFAENEIRTWCLKHIGQELEVTCVKDYGMTKLYDDRAVGVVPNTGILVQYI